MIFTKDNLFGKIDPEIRNKIVGKTIGIAGAGGLGSNVAVSLARCGIDSLVIADFDKVEYSNLNRQFYFLDQIGKYKVDALFENLMKINPFMKLEMHNTKLDSANVNTIYSKVDILVEAVDSAYVKQIIVENWVEKYPQKPIIIASGVYGFGDFEKLRIKVVDKIYICGDEETEIKNDYSPLSPKIGIVANMQADLVIKILVNGE
jgi:sulfur carrier protein ThiS adenylyltransferase